MSANGHYALASGRQLWALNTAGLLGTALSRTNPHPVSKQVAWELLADTARGVMDGTKTA